MTNPTRRCDAVFGVVTSSIDIAKQNIITLSTVQGSNHFTDTKLTNNSWQDFKYVNGTLEEWVKKSDAEIAAIEEEILEIRKLLKDQYGR